LTDYFKLCLKRFCWKRGKRLRQRIKETDSFVSDCQLTDVRQDSSPLENLLTATEVEEREACESRLREAIRQLPSDGQRLLRLYYEKKLSIPDIADRHLHISESAVKVRLHRLRRRIALCLKVDNDGKRTSVLG
jgi:RNA polymerase sigma factor (sigma-70 family)